MQETPSSSPRASLWEWALAALLLVDLGWTVLCRGGVRAETMAVTAVLTGALLVVHVLGRARAAAESRGAHPAGWWLLPFLAYALANVLWVTPVRWLGWIDWLGWAQMIAVFWVVLNGVRSRGARRLVFFALVLLGVAGVVLACYQRFVDPDWVMFGIAQRGMLHGRASGSFGIPNSLAGYLLLLLPAVGALAWRRGATPTERIWWGWVAAVMLLGLLLTISRGAWLALAVALTLWPLLAARGTWARRLRLMIVMLTAIAVIGGAIYWKSPMARARFTALVRQGGEVTRPVMWRGAWMLFRDAPLLGTGAASYNVLFDRHRPAGFRDEPLWAHNEYLNTLSDYGVAGFVLFFGACGLIAGACLLRRREEKSRRRDWLDSGTVASGMGVGLLAFALQMTLDFHLKIPALGLAAATLAALAVQRAWPTAAVAEAPARRAPRALLATIAAGAVAAALVFFVPMLRAEGWRQQARRQTDSLGRAPAEHGPYAIHLPGARDALLRATQLAPRNAQAWSDLSYVTALWARVEPDRTGELGRQAEDWAGRALHITAVCSEFWVRRGVARDMQGRWEEAGNDFAKAVELAPADSYAWYYYADHLSRRSAGRHAAEAALTFCLRLDPGNSAGLALRQRLAIKPTGH